MARTSPLSPLVLLALAAACLAGCPASTDSGPSTGGKNTPTGTGTFRVVNGIADSSSLTATVPSTGVNTGQVGVDGVSPASSPSAGIYTVQVQPDHGSGFAVGNVRIGDNMLASAIANGVLAKGTQNGFVASESLATPATGQVAVQPVFGAYAAAGGGQGSSYQFSFTPLGGTSQTNTSESTLYGQSPATLSLPAGQYRVEVYSAPNCPSGQACPANVGLVFDSGTGQGISLPATSGTGADIVQLVAVDATSAQQSQYGNGVVLLLIDSVGNVTPLYNNNGPG